LFEGARLMKQRRVGLYGGTFDPVHAGHLAVARALVEQFALDEVLFIPAHIAPHKRGLARQRPASPLHRYAMLVLATTDEPRMRVSTIELDAPERPFTVETLARLRTEFGAAARLYFVMGADSWADITTWRDWERLLTMSDHVVMARPGYELSTAHVTEALRQRIVDLRRLDIAAGARVLTADDGPHIYFTDAVWSDVSATAIRRALETGDATELPVPLPVAEYIRKYEVYGNTHDSERDDAGGEGAHD
jgi:nicotinate-nucleotide adenylyltransferase